MSWTAMDRPSGGEAEEGVHVLVVEDDEFMRQAMLMMLRSICGSGRDLHPDLNLPTLNLLVESSPSGEHAWDLMRVKRFDIAFIDVHLPGVSGLDLSWCVRASPGTDQQQSGHTLQSHETILIACTSDGTASSIIGQYGLHDVLDKPVNVIKLRHMLHKWLPRVFSAVEADAVPRAQLTQPSDGLASLQQQRSSVFDGRVLLVEDDSVTRLASSLMLQQLNLHCDVAEDGKSAMALMARCDYDPVLLVRRGPRGSSTWPSMILLALQRVRCSFAHERLRSLSAREGPTCASTLLALACLCACTPVLTPSLLACDAAGHQLARSERLCTMLLVQGLLPHGVPGDWIRGCAHIRPGPRGLPGLRDRFVPPQAALHAHVH